MPPFSYRKEIDGLRAIAVLIVVLFHAELGCPGGFVGVDVFFVLSGYLITSIILRDMRRGEFSFRAFWERRVRRIFPAMAACMAASLIAGMLLLLPSDAKSLGWSSLAQLGLVSNIYFWRTTDYFGGDIFEKPLLHTWSLSIEEQFYLFFPFMLWGASHLPGKWSPPRNPLILSVLLAAGSLLLSVWATEHQPFANFYLLPTRAWELLAGAVLAMLPSPRCNRPLRETLSWLGLGAIFAPVLLYTETTPFPGLAAVPPSLGAMLLLWSNDPSGGFSSTALGKILSFKPVRSIGWLSYSLYLWHWPILVYAKYWKLEPYSVAARWTLVGLAIAFAYLSWRFVETPIRRGRIWATRKRLWTWSALLLLALAISAFALGKGWIVWKHRSEGIVRINEMVKSDEAFLVNSSKKWPRRNQLAEIDEDRLYPLGGPAKHGKIDFALLGDSHAYRLVKLADRLARETDLSGVLISHPASPPLVDWKYRYPFSVENQADYVAAQLAHVKRHRVRHVILHAFWVSYEHKGEPFRSSFLQTIREFENLGVKVHVLMDAPDYPVSLPRSMAREEFFWGLWPRVEGMSIADYRERHAQMYALREALPQVTFVDPTDKFVDATGERYLISKDGNLLYADGHHLTQYGVEYVWKDTLKDLFLQMAAEVEGTK